LPPAILVSSDGQWNAAATAEGLTVENPSVHLVTALEDKVADLMQKVLSPPVEKDWRSTIGMFAGNALMRKSTKRGERSARPSGSKPVVIVLPTDQSRDSHRHDGFENRGDCTGPPFDIAFSEPARLSASAASPCRRLVALTARINTPSRPIRCWQALEVQFDKTGRSLTYLLPEILALTKMNWNRTRFVSAEQITLAVARNVGDMLLYLASNDPIQARHSYYM